MSKYPHEGLCALCRNHAILKDSHIIPAAAHKITKVNGKNVKSAPFSDQLDLKNQRDLKEFLLCENCETKFSVFENLAQKSLVKIWQLQPCDAALVEAESVNDLASLIHSVFWRASASKTISYKLPPDLEETLRRHLLTGTPLLFPRLPTRITNVPMFNDIGSNAMVVSPAGRERRDGIVVSYFSIYGVLLCMHSPTAMFAENKSDFLGGEPDDYFVKAPNALDMFHLIDGISAMQAQGIADARGIKQNN